MGGPPRWLVFCIGNASRGDDAVGPLFAERLAAWAEGRALPVRLTIVSEFQCQVEHVLDLQEVELALFVDAGCGGDDIDLAPLPSRRDHSFSSHRLSPACLLAVAGELGQTLPAAWLLVVRGDDFTLGAPLGAGADARLAAALRHVGACLERGRLAPLAAQ